MTAPNHSLRVVFEAAEVRERIEALAAEIARDLGRGPWCMVVIAEGARAFAAVLSDSLEKRAVRLDHVIVKARRTDGVQLLPPRLEIPPAASFSGRTVLVVDDISDEGRTLDAMLRQIGQQQPALLKVAVLVDKQERRALPLHLDYVGFQVDHGWVVGFGMDLDDQYRDLDHLAVVEPGR